MEYSNKSFPEALKEIMEKKDAVHRKLASKTNFSFTYFCVLKKEKIILLWKQLKVLLKV